MHKFLFVINSSLIFMICLNILNPVNWKIIWRLILVNTHKLKTYGQSKAPYEYVHCRMQSTTWKRKIHLWLSLIIQQWTIRSILFLNFLETVWRRGVLQCVSLLADTGDSNLKMWKSKDWKSFQVFKNQSLFRNLYIFYGNVRKVVHSNTQQELVIASSGVGVDIWTQKDKV